MAQMEAGQVPEVTQEQSFQVGFEKALVMMNPDWRAEFTETQVNQFRHYYHQGVQDMHLLNQLAHQNAQQNYQAVVNTIIVTGNEQKIAELQSAQAQAAAAEAEQPAKAKRATKTKASPAKVPARVQPKAVKGKARR
jgi:hypothetical protein